MEEMVDASVAGHADVGHKVWDKADELHDLDGKEVAVRYEALPCTRTSELTRQMEKCGQIAC